MALRTSSRRRRPRRRRTRNHLSIDLFRPSSSNFDDDPSTKTLTRSLSLSCFVLLFFIVFILHRLIVLGSFSDYAMMNQETQTSLLLTDEFFDDQATTQARDDELSRLAEYMVSEAPDYSLITDLILESLGLAVPDRQDSPSSSTDQRASIIVKHPYPPIYRRGVVLDHDRPYADFGHLGSFLSSSLKKQPSRYLRFVFRSTRDRENVSIRRRRYQGCSSTGEHLQPSRRHLHSCLGDQLSFSIQQ